MVKVVCKYDSIAEIPHLNSKKNYEQIVSPLDYSFSLEKGSLYDLLGITQLSNILHFYFVANGSDELDIAPAVLFECDWSKIPENWYLRMNSLHEENFEILPERLSKIDGWFEKYIDEDPEVLEIVKTEIDNIVE